MRTATLNVRSYVRRAPVDKFAAIRKALHERLWNERLDHELPAHLEAVLVGATINGEFGA